MDDFMLRLIISIAMIAAGLAVFWFVVGRSPARADERAHARAVARAAALHRRDEGESTYRDGGSQSAPPPSAQE